MNLVTRAKSIPILVSLILLGSPAFSDPMLSGGPLWQADPWCLDISQRLKETSKLSIYRRDPAQDESSPNTLCCSLVVKPNGSIAQLKIAKSSGSNEVDSMALDLIRSSSPFSYSDPSLGDLSYSIEFPAMFVKPLTAAHSEYRIRTEECSFAVPDSERLYPKPLQIWLSECQQRLLNAASTQQQAPNNALSCLVTVNQHGEICDIKVSKTSGSAIDDKLGVNFISATGPFSPIPPFSPSSKYYESQKFLVEFYGGRPTVKPFIQSTDKQSS